MFWIVLTYAIFAFSFTVSKAALAYGEPIFMVAVRMIFAGPLILSLFFWKNGRVKQIEVRALPYFFGAALFNIYLTNVLEFSGLKYMTSFKTCFLYSLSPFIASLLSFISFGEKLSRNKWLALIVGFLGFCPMLINKSTEEMALEGSLGAMIGPFSLPELLVLGAACATSYGWISVRRLVHHMGYDPLLVNGWSMLFGGLFALATSLLFEEWRPVPVFDVGPFIGLVFTVALLSNGIAYNLYGWLLKKFTATFLALCGFIAPLLTAAFGSLFLGEQVTLSFFFSLTVVSLALFLFYREELLPGTEQSPRGVEEPTGELFSRSSLGESSVQQSLVQQGSVQPSATATSDER